MVKLKYVFFYILLSIVSYSPILHKQDDVFLI